ncbi:MAG: AraC family transcriptional regulator [Clostridia bacterium]|nr:AraC family transcriptional regulator [Clostridia bacterium]
MQRLRRDVPSYLFRAVWHFSPKTHDAQRLKRAKAILESGEYKNITEIARTVGYEDPLYFSCYFRTFYGSSPSHFS